MNHLGCPDASNVGQPIAYMGPNGTWCNKFDYLNYFVCEFRQRHGVNDTEWAVIAVFSFAFIFVVSLAWFFRVRKQARATGLSFCNRLNCLHYLWRPGYSNEAARQITTRQDNISTDRITGADDLQKDACSEKTYYSVDADALPSPVSCYAESITFHANTMSTTRPTSTESLESMRRFSSLDCDDAVAKFDVSSPHSSSLVTVS